MSTPLALDATLWDEPVTGIGLYTHALAGALSAQGSHPRLFGARTTGGAPRGRLGRTAWTLGALPTALQDHDVRCYHAFGNFNLPLARLKDCRFVLTVHDVIPLLLPDTVSRPFHWQFRLWLSRSVQLADQILCVSETTRRDLVRCHPAAGGKATVVLNGVDHVAQHRALTPASLAAVDALELPEHYVLFAGAWDVRKNLKLVLSAFRRLPARSRPSLVLAGQPWFGSGAANRQVAELRADGRDVRVLGYLPSPVLYEVMARAAVFVFPSLYEGFGLPALEAMWLSVPTVISQTGSLPEVCGDAALAVDPEDDQGLAAAIAQLLRPSAERTQRQRAGRAWAEAFTWQRAARQTLEIYRSLS